MKGTITTLLAVAVLLSAPAGKLFAGDDVRVGVYQNSPKISVNQMGIAEGFFIDILGSIASEEGWRLRYVPGTWSECLERLVNGQIDILPDIAYSEARALRFDFNDKTVLSNWAVVYSPEGSEIESFSDLRGKRIAFMRGDITVALFESQIRAFGLDYSVVEAADYEGVFKLLARGEADAGVVNHLFGARHEKSYRLSRSPIICCPRELRFAVPKNRNIHLLQAIDRHLGAMMSDRRSIYYGALTRWIEREPVRKLPWWSTTALIVAGGMILILAAAAAATRFQVKARTAALSSSNKKFLEEAQKRKKSEEKLRITLEATQVGLWDWDMEEDLWYATPTFFRMLGYDYDPDAGGLKREVWGERTHPDDREFVVNKMVEVRDEGQAGFDIEFRLRHADGTYRWINSVGRAVAFGPDKKTVRMVGLHIDVSERKWAWDEIQRRVDELGALNSLGRKIIGSLTVDDVIAVGIEEVLKTVLPDMAQVFLRDSDRLILKKADFPNGRDRLCGMPEHRVGECLCGLAMREERAVFSRDIHADRRCTRAECKAAGLRSYAALPLISQGEPLGVMGIASLTERDFEAQSGFLETLASTLAVGLNNARLYDRVQEHAVELEERVARRTEELNRATLRAQEADRLKSVFLATMSHELRTPLNSIIGFTGILLQGLVGPLTGEQAKQLGMVQSSGRHLLDLINDILDISRIEAGQLEISREPFDLAEVVLSVVDSTSPVAEKAGVRVIAAATGPVPIDGDRRRTVQVLMNLLGNAVKFTPEGGEVNVGVEAEAPGPGRVRVWVRDTGIGIRAGDMDKLFEPFRQIDTGLTRQYEGTGLGLSISKRLVEMMGGTIQAESGGPGKGSLFTLTFPASPSVGAEGSVT